MLIDINEDDLMELLCNRVKYWTKDDDAAFRLFESMYQNLVDGGCFDGFKDFSVNYIVDNDYINNKIIIYKDDDDWKALKKLYDKCGIGDVSCEDKSEFENYDPDFIEAYDEESGAFLIG